MELRDKTKQISFSCLTFRADRLGSSIYYPYRKQTREKQSRIFLVEGKPNYGGTTMLSLLEVAQTRSQ